MVSRGNPGPTNETPRGGTLNRAGGQERPIERGTERERERGRLSQLQRRPINLQSCREGGTAAADATWGPAWPAARPAAWRRGPRGSPLRPRTLICPRRRGGPRPGCPRSGCVPSLLQQRPSSGRATRRKGHRGGVAYASPSGRRHSRHPPPHATQAARGAKPFPPPSVRSWRGSAAALLAA